MLYFERVDIRNDLDFSKLPNQMDASILCQDTNISLYELSSCPSSDLSRSTWPLTSVLPGLLSRNRDPSLMKHECLGNDELPTPGTLVAIDAEFVSMQQVSFCRTSSFLTFMILRCSGRD